MPRNGIVPDVSLGTHFFNDLVELDMLYLAVFPEKEGYGWNDPFFTQTHNRLTDLVPEAAAWAEVIKVIDAADIDPEAGIFLNADAMKQKAVCYWQSRP